MNAIQRVFRYHLGWLLCSLWLAGVPARALDPKLRISQYGHVTYRLQDGTLPALVFSMAQTGDGAMWFGGSEGLLRFDGVKFVPWQPPAGASLPAAEVGTLKAGRDGSLWIGTFGGLAHLSGGKLTNFSEHQSQIEEIFEDMQGTIWFTRARVPTEDKGGGLCRVEGLHIRCFGAQDGFPFSYAQPLTRDSSGAFWIGTDVAYTRWRPGAAQTFTPAGLAGAKGQYGISALEPAADGSVWVGSFRAGRGLGLERFDHGKTESLRVGAIDTSRWKVNSLRTDQAGALWVGTVEHGIERVYQSKIEHFGASDGLTGDSVGQVFEDREHDLWVITTEGIDCFRSLPVVSYSMHEGLSSPSVHSIVAANDGSLWAANTGAIDVLKDGVVHSLRKAQGLPGEIVTALAEDKQGRMWVGVDDKLAMYDKGKFHVLPMPAGTPASDIASIAVDIAGDVWFVLQHSASSSLFHVHAMKVEVQSVPDNLPRSQAVVADPLGGVWLGLMNGDLAQLKNGQFKLYAGLHGGNARHAALRQMKVLHDGSIMVPSQFGLLWWKEGQLSKIGATEGLACASVDGVQQDQAGDLFLNTSCGVIAVAWHDLQRWREFSGERLSNRLYGPSDGARFYHSYQTPSAALTKDGRVWFTNYQVLQTLNPRELNVKSPPPPVEIDSFRRDNAPVAGTQGLRFAPHLHSLEIDYSAFTFASAAPVRFRYRLEGQDHDWQESGSRRQALYNDLGPGTYTFHVVALNGDGVWDTKGASTAFTVAPAFYQRALFKVLLFSVAGAFLFLLYRLRLATISRQLTATFNGQVLERERIARELHDTLLQGFQGLVLIFQNVLTQLPAANPSHAALSKALDRADEVLQDGRQRVRNLRSEGDLPLSLAQALRQSGQELLCDQGMQFCLQVEGEERPLAPIVRDETYLIGREALRNVHQHSSAKNVEVVLRYSRAHFNLVVRDDGRGIPDAILDQGRSGHWGIVGMRERAAYCGGKLTFESRQEEGTKVHLQLPAKRAYDSSFKFWSWRDLLAPIQR